MNLVFLFVISLPFIAIGRQTEAYIPGKIPLTLAANGIAGWIEVRIDPRFTKRAEKAMWDIGPWDFVLDEDDPLYKAFSARPPKNAALCIVDSFGHVVEMKKLEQPLAKIVKIFLRDGETYYLLAVDYSAGFGSYSGPTADVIEVRGGRLRAVEATDSSTGKSEPISVCQTLQSNWTFMTVKGGMDILALDCRPTLLSTSKDTSGMSKDDYITQYTRYHFDGSKWLKLERSEKRYWDSEEDFPERSAFP